MRSSYFCGYSPLPTTTTRVKIPLDVLLARVYPRVHELRLRATLLQLRRLGPSRLEAMPDFPGTVPEKRGWSGRVSEALGVWEPRVHKCAVLAQIRNLGEAMGPHPDAA